MPGLSLCQSDYLLTPASCQFSWCVRLDQPFPFKKNLYGGYLKIWPEETDNTTEQIPVVTPEEPATASQEADSDNEDTRPTKIRRLSPQIKEGTNGRKITVLYQGSGETPGEAIEPKRKPCFTEDLTVDQTDIVANQIKSTNHTSAFIQTEDVLLFNNTQEFLSYYSQAMKEQPTPNTTSAEIPSDANKHDKLYATTQTQTQPSIIFSQLRKGTEEMTTQTPDIPESTPINSTIEKKLEELLNTQNTILQILRRQNDGSISDILNLTNSIPDLLDNNEPDQQSIVKYIIKYPSSEETKQQTDSNDQPAVSSDILSPPALSSDEETFLPPITRPRKTATPPTTFGPDDILSSTLQAIQTLACKTVTPTATPSMQPSSSESIVSTDISPTTVSISQMQSLTGTSTPLPTTLLPLVETHPISISNLSNGRPSKEVSWRKTKTITKCFSGALLEVVSPADLLPALADTEVRIKPDKVRTIMTDSVSPRNFGWNLVKMLFSPQEIIGRNFWGNKGKIPLSPRRRHAIEHAIIDTYGQENLQTCITGINTGIRNFRSER
ncbi:unnamed protein product [Mytilus coruscus]|uniref:BEN domain-containing protein n=1 Tax=Mytilus coruscus TaxID=42192 RepID=A0A6J8AB86_MYTCO|nr:unnamed protein product [Mytilus coruscus]